MLKKLLWYNLRTVGKRWGIFAIVSPIASITAALCLRLWWNIFNQAALPTPGLAVLGSFAMAYAVIAIAAIAASLVSLLVLLESHYRRSLFSDRGYLTLMVPAERKTLFHAHLLSAGIFSGIELLNLIFSVIVLFTFSIPQQGSAINLKLLRGICDFFVSSWEQFGAAAILKWHLILFIAIGFVAFEIHLLYGFVTLVRSKGSLLWIATNSGILEIVSLLASLGANGAIAFMAEQPLPVQNAVSLLALLVVVIALAIANIFFYNVGLQKLRYKLNLA